MKNTIIIFPEIKNPPAQLLAGQSLDRLERGKPTSDPSAVAALPAESPNPPRAVKRTKRDCFFFFEGRRNETGWVISNSKLLVSLHCCEDLFSRKFQRVMWVFVWICTRYCTHASPVGSGSNKNEALLAQKKYNSVHRTPSPRALITTCRPHIYRPLAPRSASTASNEPPSPSVRTCFREASRSRVACCV
jgi:hypothetical protein